jgi:AraC-like DNA-binding protein
LEATKLTRTPARRQSAGRTGKPGRATALGIAGIGRVYLWQGGSLWIGRDSGRALPHAHHAIQISLALDEPDTAFLLRGDGCKDWTASRAAIVMPHRRHEFDGCGGTIAQIFIEPETTQGRALLARFHAADLTELPLEAIGPGAELLGARFGGGRDDLALITAARRIVDSLAGPLQSAPAASPRVAAAIAFMVRRLSSDISLSDVAAAVHLSPGRLRHLFVQETGATYRGYVLWLRINCAVKAMMDGRTWTAAAHEAGFADSAHLSRTFRRMFGVSPAMLVKDQARS